MGDNDRASMFEARIIKIMKFKIVIISLLLFLLNAFDQQGYAKGHPGAKKGILDLRNYDLSLDGNVVLDGEWEFYWRQFLNPGDFENGSRQDSLDYISIPGYWNDYQLNGEVLKGEGYATYRLIILTDSLYGQLAFKLYTISTAYKIFVNGIEITSVGSIASNKDSGKPGYHPKVIDFKPDSKRLEVILQVSNYHHRRGGPWESIQFGLEKTIREKHLLNIILDFFLVGSIFIMALYHFAIFFLRRKNWSSLIFGICCLTIVFRLVSTGECSINLIPGFNWQLLVKIEYLSIYLALVFFPMFVHSLFPKDFSKVLLRIIQFLGIGLSLIVLLTPVAIFSYTIPVFYPILMVVTFYGIYSLIVAVWNKRDGAIPFLTGFLVFTITIINDLLYQEEVIYTGNFIPAGLFILLFFQSYSLATRFTAAFRHNEELTGKLNFQNENLEKLVEERTQRLQVLNKELTTSIATKNKFFSIIAHDLKNPFGNVINLSELIYTKIDTYDKDKIKQLAGYIHLSANQLFELLENLLDWSRAKTNKIRFAPRKLNLSDMINNTILIFEINSNKKKVELIYDTRGEIIVFADENMVLAILRNLISNAIKYSFKNGRVSICAENVDGFVEITVTDKGVGIKPDNLNKLFREDENYSELGTDKEKGTGLGLILCKEFVEKCGGKIMVKSEQGEGSSFIFTLPEGM
jgi:signal transduction histidine kinase